MGEENVELSVEVVHITDKAILIDEGDEQIWLPKSQIRLEHSSGNTYSVEIPEWLAMKKGLL